MACYGDETADKKRDEYMNHEVGHHEFYCWLSDYIGLPDSLIPATNERVLKAIAAGDEHLNTIPLQTWDNQHGFVRTIAGRKVRSWALSDSVCCLKAIAIRRAGGLGKEWVKIKEVGAYTIWRFGSSESGVFNATKDGNPPTNGAGYYSMESLSALKGIR